MGRTFTVLLFVGSLIMLLLLIYLYKVKSDFFSLVFVVFLLYPFGIDWLEFKHSPAESKKIIVKDTKYENFYTKFGYQHRCYVTDNKNETYKYGVLGTSKQDAKQYCRHLKKGQKATIYYKEKRNGEQLRLVDKN